MSFEGLNFAEREQLPFVSFENVATRHVHLNFWGHSSSESDLASIPRFHSRILEFNAHNPDHQIIICWENNHVKYSDIRVFEENIATGMDVTEAYVELAAPYLARERNIDLDTAKATILNNLLHGQKYLYQADFLRSLLSLKNALGEKLVITFEGHPDEYESSRATYSKYYEVVPDIPHLHRELIDALKFGGSVNALDVWKSYIIKFASYTSAREEAVQLRLDSKVLNYDKTGIFLIFGDSHLGLKDRLDGEGTSLTVEFAAYETGSLRDPFTAIVNAYMQNPDINEKVWRSYFLAFLIQGKVVQRQTIPYRLQSGEDMEAHLWRLFESSQGWYQAMQKRSGQWEHFLSDEYFYDLSFSNLVQLS